MTTGQKIKKLRQSRNLSQKELGIMSGLSEPAIRNYELGNRTPSAQQLEKIASALNVSVYAISDPEIDDYIGVLHTLFEHLACGLCCLDTDHKPHTRYAFNPFRVFKSTENILAFLPYLFKEFFIYATEHRKRARASYGIATKRRTV